MSRVNRNLIDPATLISRKYFSSVGRGNHAVDIHHDKANLFPELHSFKKTSCAIHSQSFGHHENSRSKSVPKAPQRLHLPIASNKSFTRETKEAPPISMHSSVLITGEKQKLVDLEEKRERILQDLYVPPEEKMKVSEEKEKTVEIEGSPIQENRTKKSREHKIVEKSKQLLQSIRSPQEIFRKLRQANLAGVDQSRGLQELEKIKGIAKKLDMNLSFEVVDDLHKAGKFLKEIPIEYYQKMRKKKLSPDRSGSNMMSYHASSIFSTQIAGLERRGSLPSSGRASLGVRDMSARFISVADYENGFDTEDKNDKNDKKRILKGLDIVRKEKSLFLSPLEEYVNSYNKLPANKKAATSPGGVHKRDIKAYSYGYNNMAKKSEDEKIETSVWIDQISTLRAGINDYFSKRGDERSFVNGCQKRIGRHISKLGLSKLPSKDALTKNTEGDYEKGEQNEIIDEAKNRDSKVYSILKSVVGTKTGSTGQGVKEHLEFYRKLLAKEQRKANKTLANQAVKKSENQTSTSIGRDIFNNNNGYCDKVLDNFTKCLVRLLSFIIFHTLC